MTSSDLCSDGNALTGPFQDRFCVQVTTAIGRCTGCGRTAAMTELQLYDHAPGLVARCPSCDQALARLVRDPGRAWLDLRGLVDPQLPIPDQT